MATYAIGDIQGCFDALQALLGKIGFSAGRDRLWLVGDLVNRGTQSAEVLRFVRDLGEGAVTVLGNHDLHLIMVAAGYGKAHPEDTHEQVLQAPDGMELVAWLRQQRMFHVEAKYALVHAGLLPGWTVAQALDLGREVEAALRRDDHLDFLAHMWGSEPRRWDDALSGWDRLRVIVNAMTRMRVCSADGVMELKFKGPPDMAPVGYVPWFSVPGRASADHTIVCGHWSALGFLAQPSLLALDTGCLWGGALTAVRLEDGRRYQVQCPRALKPKGRD